MPCRLWRALLLLPSPRRSLEAGHAAVVHVNAVRKPDQDPGLPRASPQRGLIAAAANSIPGTAEIADGLQCVWT
jgi:hypothetical protein